MDLYNPMPVGQRSFMVGTLWELRYYRVSNVPLSFEFIFHPIKR